VAILNRTRHSSGNWWRFIKRQKRKTRHQLIT